jgi:hypothetical protein
MFSEAERRLLWSILSRRARPLLPSLQALDSSALTDAIVHGLMDAVGSELADKGFQPDDTINEYGSALEELLAKIVREFDPGARAS